ncbi:DUF1330 domain-containing protein [Rheinheimera sediminis]|uniref:DUF1330 domain-containing protein n=1 Tax=Rheinheimera sp. YQF-1 TaxID=2499626 RepID=UPI000FDA4735|nr:DUF1330 domain-containing protein [Rheinheimera sp. YQF-1]RVT44213.1 DUF1330 domain-containing protein [Rheinheimera sp. YQF-1]
MSYLLIVETNIAEPSWVNEYLRKVTPLVNSFGGKYLTRTSAIELLEGTEKPQFSVVAQFPTKEDALGFYNSEEYRPFKQARQSGSVSKFLLVPVENATA